MKFLKWHLVSDLDDYIYGRNTIRILEDKIKFYEKENYKQYQEIERLKEENKWLREHQKIETVNLEEVKDDSYMQ